MPESPAASLRERRLREAAGLALWALALLWFAALASYDPLDPNVMNLTSRIRPENWAGRFGANLAELSLQILGLGAFALPLAAGGFGTRLFRPAREEAWPTRAVGLALGLVGLCGLFALGGALEPVTIAYPFGGDHLIPRGGYVGRLLIRPLDAVLGGFGSAVALVALTGLAVLLATSLSLAEVAQTTRRRGTIAFLALIRRWTHAREHREKQAMKRDVVRKHIDRASSGASAVEAVRPEGARVPLRVVSVVGEPKPTLFRRLQAPPAPPSPRPRRERTASSPIRAVAAASAAPPIPLPVPRPPLPPIPMRSSPRESGPLAPPAAPPVRVRREAPSEDEIDVLDLSMEVPPLERPPRIAAERPKPPRPHPKQGILTDVAHALSGYVYPSTSLLDPVPVRNEEIDNRALYEIGALIRQKCSEFKVEGDVEEIQPGPVVTTYEFKPSIGVKYNRIVNLADDLALALRAESIRIERIPGRSTVGIEVPNAKPETIPLRELFEAEKFATSKSFLTLVLGKDIHGLPMITDLQRMPHMLIAGTTGSGKSVGINTMITSILYKARPADVKLIMIDPKMVELKPYEDLPHLACPIVTDPKKAANALKWAVAEMEDRYRLLATCGVRNIDQFNEFLKDPAAVAQVLSKISGSGEPPKLEQMPFIVIIIDELADLMMTAPKEVEESIGRLAQMARAVGIHLIIATQRPSVDVITGVIKANFPSRIAFQVFSKIDSRTILDGNGAEKLLGRGDMLFLPPGTSRLIRIHGAYISEKETANIVKFLKAQGEPQYNDEILRDRTPEAATDGPGSDDADEDPMYDDAARLVVTSGQASASWLQRKLKLGYARAARLIDMMERDGIVGPGQGAKPREIRVPPDYFDQVDQRS